MATVLSLPQIRQLWIDAGGDPQYADTAAQQAVATSGGNPNVPGGLWGKKTSANTSALDEARQTISQTNGGRDFSSVAAGIDLPNPVDWIADLFGADEAAAYTWRAIGWSAMIVGGWLLMILGFSLMIWGSRAVKQAAGALLGSIAGGVGFGVGANVGTGGKAGKAVAAATDPTSGPPAPGPGTPVAPTSPAPTPPPAPAAPAASRGFITSPPTRRGVRWTTPTREMPVVPSQGGPAHAPTRKPRERIPTPVSRGGGLFQSRRKHEPRHAAKTGGRHQA